MKKLKSVLEVAYAVLGWVAVAFLVFVVSLAFVDGGKAYPQSTSTSTPIQQVVKNGNRYLQSSLPFTSVSTDFLYSKFTPVVDVRAWGAKCDGVTDDTASINAAIVWASVAGGGEVLIPATTAPCVADGILLMSSVSLHGTHRRMTSLLHKPHGSHSLISISNSSQVRWGIYDLGIDGNKANQTLQLDEIHIDGAAFQVTHRSTIRGIDVLNSSGNGVYTTESAGGGGAIDILEVNSNGNARDGIYIGTDDTYCLRCETSQNGIHGVEVNTAGNVHVVESKAWENGGDGYHLVNASGGVYSAIESQSNGGVGFNAINSQDLLVSAHLENDTTGLVLNNANTSNFSGVIILATGFGISYVSGGSNLLNFVTRANVSGDTTGTFDGSNKVILNGAQVSGTSSFSAVRSSSFESSSGDLDVQGFGDLYLGGNLSRQWAINSSGTMFPISNSDLGASGYQIGHIFANQYVGPATALSGSCAINGAWFVSQDGHLGFCKSGTWENVTTAP